MGGNNKVEFGKEIALINGRLDRLPMWGASKAAFWVVGVTWFFVWWDLMAIAFILPALIGTFHLRGNEIALPISANLFAYVVGAYVIGTFSDYWGRRSALRIAVVILTIGALGSAFSWDLASLTAFRAIVGFGMGSQIALGTVIIGELSSAKNRGRSLALNAVFGSFAAAVMPFLAIWLLGGGAIGWRLILGLAALVGLALVFMREPWLPESPRWMALHGRINEAKRIVEQFEENVRVRIKSELPPVPDVPTERLLSRFPTAELFRKPYLSRLILVFLFWFFMYVGTYGFGDFQAVLFNKMGFPLLSSFTYVGVGMALYFIGTIVNYFIVDLGQRKYLLGACLVVLIVGVGIIAGGASATAMILGVSLVNLPMMAAANQAYTYTSEIFPTRARGTAMSIGDGLGHLGGAVSPYIVIAILGSFGPRAAWWSLAASVFVALLLMLFGGLRTTGEGLTELAQ